MASYDPLLPPSAGNSPESSSAAEAGAANDSEASPPATNNAPTTAANAAANYDPLLPPSASNCPDADRGLGKESTSDGSASLRRVMPTMIHADLPPTTDDASSGSLEIDLASLPPALRPTDFSIPPAMKPGDFNAAPALRPNHFAGQPQFGQPSFGHPAAPMSPPTQQPPMAATNIPTAVAAAIPMALPAAPLAAIPQAIPVAADYSGIPVAAPAYIPEAALYAPMAMPADSTAVDHGAANYGGAPWAAPLAAIPVAEVPFGVAAPMAAPVAEIPVATAIGATAVDGFGQPLSPASFSNAVPVGTALPVAAAPLAAVPAAHADSLAPDLAVSGTRSFKRSRTSMAAMAGIPAALIVAIGLMLLYVTESGPFRTDHPPSVTANNRPAANNGETPGAAASTQQSENGDKPPGVTPPKNNSEIKPPNSTPQNPADSNGNSQTETNPPTAGNNDPAPSDDPTDGIGNPTASTNPEKPPTVDKPDPLVDQQVARALMAARYYLAHRDLPAAKTQLDLAKNLDSGNGGGDNGGSGKRYNEILRVSTLHHYLGEFWRAVGESIKGLEGGDQVTISGVIVGVVEVTPSKLILRQAGRNREYSMESMPRGLAHGLAEMWLTKNDAASYLILASFNTVHPGDSPESRAEARAEARKLYDLAARVGEQDVKETVATLLPELEVKIPDDLASLPQPNPRMPDPKSSNPASDEPRVRIPTEVEITAAKAAIVKQFRVEIDEAVSAAEKTSLAEKMDAQARREDIADLTRYALWEMAREQLMEIQRIDLAVAIVDGMAEHFAVEALEVKGQMLAEMAKTVESAEMNKQLTETAMAIADEALLQQKYPSAIKLLRGALATARKAKDPALIKEANGRLNEALAQARGQ